MNKLFKQILQESVRKLQMQTHSYFSKDAWSLFKKSLGDF